MPANTKTGYADLFWCHGGMPMQKVEHRPAIRIEIGDKRFGGVLHPLIAARIVKRDDNPRLFETAVYLGCGDHKTITREP